MADIQFEAWVPPPKAQARKKTAGKKTHRASKVTEGNYASRPLPKTVSNHMSLGLTLPSKTPISLETDATGTSHDVAGTDEGLALLCPVRDFGIVDRPSDSSSDVDSLFDDEDQLEDRRSKRRKTSDDSTSTMSLQVIDLSSEKESENDNNWRSYDQQRLESNGFPQSAERADIAHSDGQVLSNGSSARHCDPHVSHRPPSGLTFPVASQALPETTTSGLTFPVAPQAVTEPSASRTTRHVRAQAVPELSESATISPTIHQAAQPLQAHLSGTSKDSVTRFLRAMISVFSKPDEGHLIGRKIEDLKQLPELPIDAELRPIFNALTITFQRDPTFQTSLMAFLVESLQSADVDWEEVCADPVELISSSTENWGDVDKMTDKEKTDEIVRLRGRLAEISRHIKRLHQNSARLKEKYKSYDHYKKIAQRPLFVKEQAATRAANKAKGHYLSPAEFAHYKLLLEAEKHGFAADNERRHDPITDTSSSEFGLLLLHRSDTDLYPKDRSFTTEPNTHFIDLSTPEPCESTTPLSVPTSSVVMESATARDLLRNPTTPYCSPYLTLPVQASSGRADGRLEDGTAQEASTSRHQAIENDGVIGETSTSQTQSCNIEQAIEGSLPSWSHTSIRTVTGQGGQELINETGGAALISALEQELLDELDTSGFQGPVYSLDAQVYTA